MVSKGTVIRLNHIGVSSLRTGPFFTVASVELGNTTTKCILISTNLQTAEVFQIAKEVRLTRDIRSPDSGEKIFGSTIAGVPLTEGSVAGYVSDIIHAVIKKSRIDIDKDLHFVVRSTGVNAGFTSPEEVGAIVRALAEGCLQAGIPPRKMTAALSLDNLPPGLRDYSWLKRVYFDGAVAASLPPSNTSIVANEMEGELVTAGLKGAAKSTNIDFRNPVMTLDFGTTLAGRVTDASFPYAKTIGSFAGLAGAIPDAIIQGTSFVVENGNMLDIELPRRIRKVQVDDKWVNKAHELINVCKVPEGIKKFGTVPVNTDAASESGVVLIGVDAGENGSFLNKLKNLGSEMENEGGIELVLNAIDFIQSKAVQRILDIALSENLILSNTSLGLTGRAITSGSKPRIIANHLQEGDDLWVGRHDLLFVEDGLATGAAVAARCMNSLGTRENPMGGRKGDSCIMGARRKLQKK